MRIVISQPMFFPWPGLFEQVKTADAFVHLDDVAIPQGRSFISRVQIKSPTGPTWLTAPVLRGHQTIENVKLDNSQNWRERHLRMLTHNYAASPHSAEMIAFVREIYARDDAQLSDLNIAATERIARKLHLSPRFLRSSQLGVKSAGSERLRDIMLQLGGDTYVTGHGAKNYLDHALFETAGISVEYMNYSLSEYPQLHGAFTPFVSILDAIANLGPRAADVLKPATKGWRDFLHHEEIELTQLGHD